VQLVDEDDEVLVLDELLHDGLEALLELAAVLRPGHDQRQVQRDDAFVGEERRDLAVDDPLGQPLHDGRLADTRLADEHRIVLGAAAQDLNHPVQLVVAADEGIQLPAEGALGQIAGEFVDDEGILLLAGRLARLLGGLGRTDGIADDGEPQPLLVQQPAGGGLFLPQQAEQDVLGPHKLVAQQLRLLRGVVQHPLGIARQRDLDGRGDLIPQPRLALDRLAQRFERRLPLREEAAELLVLPNQAEEDVLGIDGAAAQLTRFIPGEENHPAGFLGVFLKHGVATSPPAEARRPPSTL